MRIKELHIRNIASIEKADIDFENDLIDSNTGKPASLFLISGDTGAGKSVILDAISMALYKNTPRLEGVADKANNNFSNNEGETLDIKSIVQYTRLGISEKDDCYSEVVFEGNDGRIYSAKLELGLCKSNRKDADGKYPIKHHTPVWTLTVGNECYQKSEVTKRIIHDAVGLTFLQFGKMAMLAQGQFAEFLTGDKDKREAILEQLTNTEKFSKYGEAIKNIYAKAKKAKETAEEVYAAESQHVLEAEDIARLNEKLSSCNKEKERLDKQINKADSTLKSLNEYANAEKDRKEAEKETARLNGIVASDEYKQKTAIVKDWDATDIERMQLSTKRQAQRKEVETQEMLKQAKNTFDILSSDIIYRMKDIERQKGKLQQLQRWIEEHAAQDELFTNANAIDERLKQYYELTKEQASDENKLAQAKEKTQELQADINKKAKLARDAEEAVKEKQDKIDKLTAKRTDLDISGANNAIRECNKRKTRLTLLKTRIDDLEKDKKKNADQKLDIDGKEAKLDELKVAYDTAEKAYKTAYDTKEKAQALFSTMQLSLDDKLCELRRRMHDNHVETCPLCRQHIYTLHIDEDFSSTLTPLQEAEEKATAEFIEANKRRNEAKSAYDTLNGTVKTNKDAYRKMAESIATAEAIIQKQAEESGLDIQNPLPPQIDAKIKEVEEKEANYKDIQDKAEKLQININKLNDEKKPLDDAKKKADESKHEADKVLEKNTTTITTVSDNIAARKQKISETSSALAAVLDAYYPSWKKEDVRNALTTDAKVYNDKKEQIRRDQQQIGETERELQRICDIQTAILQQHTEWTKATTPCQYTSNNITMEWNNISTSLSGLRQTQTSCIQRINEADNILNNYYQASGKTEEELSLLIDFADNIVAARESVHNINTQLKSSNDAIAAANARIEKAKGELGINNKEELPDKSELEQQRAEADNKRQDCVMQIGAIKAQFKENDDNKAKEETAREKLDKARKEFERWNKYNNIFGGSRFRRLVQTYILRPLLHNANIYLEQITDRYTLTCSEENEKLAILVLDKYNKNQVRSVTLLSGGERFMISLALSLALSSLNRPDLNVNILFIDEGFGTLDEKNLFSVMSTLEKLQDIAGQSNRRVGIISHREELETIPTQIQVKKKGEGRSLVEIVNVQ